MTQAAESVTHMCSLSAHLTAIMFDFGAQVNYRALVSPAQLML